MLFQGAGGWVQRHSPVTVLGHQAQPRGGFASCIPPCLAGRLLLAGSLYADSPATAYRGKYLEKWFYFAHQCFRNFKVAMTQRRECK